MKTITVHELTYSNLCKHLDGQDKELDSGFITQVRHPGFYAMIDLIFEDDHMHTVFLLKYGELLNTPAFTMKLVKTRVNAKSRKLKGSWTFDKSESIIV